MLQYGVASLIAAYTLGTLAGPIVSGAALDRRPHGLLVVLGLGSGILLLCALRYARGRRPTDRRSLQVEQGTT